MISLNMKLQSSATKNLAKNIDLEVKKLEARESKELLGIVQVRETFQASSYAHLLTFPQSPTSHNSTSNPPTHPQPNATSSSSASSKKWTS
jgi:hypothetical protein